jgi:uncharacterized protein
MKQINSPADFEAMLQAEWAVVFVVFQSPEWAEGFERDWEPRFEQVAQRPGGRQVKSFLLRPDGHPYTWKWVNQAFDTLGENESPSDCFFQLKKGELTGGMFAKGILSESSFVRMTGQFFSDRETIDPGLLKILCCPETHQELKLATAQVLEKLNEQIAVGHLQNRAGRVLCDKIDAGLVRADGRLLYPIRENIPVLLVDESIPLNG